MRHTTIIGFVSGMIVGAVGTYLVMKKGMDEIVRESEELQDEFDTFLNAYNELLDEKAIKVDDKEVHEHVSKNKPDINTVYKEKSVNYSDMFTKNKDEKGTDEEMKNTNVVLIDENEYDALDDYTNRLYYWNEDEKFMMDEDGDIIDEKDWKADVGTEFLAHFNDTELKCVFVRNNATRTDYEIDLCLGVEGEHYPSPIKED